MEVIVGASYQYRLFIYPHVDEYARYTATEYIFSLAVFMFYLTAYFMSVSYGYFYLP